MFRPLTFLLLYVFAMSFFACENSSEYSSEPIKGPEVLMAGLLPNGVSREDSTLLEIRISSFLLDDCNEFPVVIHPDSAIQKRINASMRQTFGLSESLEYDDLASLRLARQQLGKYSGVTYSITWLDRDFLCLQVQTSWYGGGSGMGPTLQQEDVDFCFELATGEQVSDLSQY